MGEIKPGDRVWVKDVAALVDEGIVFVETGADGAGYATHSCYNVGGYVIPDSPALPAVAALLSSEPGLAAAVGDALHHLKALRNSRGEHLPRHERAVLAIPAIERLAQVLEETNGK